MANHVLRGELIKAALNGFDDLERKLRTPAAALNARMAKINPTEIVMANLAAAIMFLAKRQGEYMTRQLINEVFSNQQLVEAAKKNFETNVETLLKDVKL